MVKLKPRFLAQNTFGTGKFHLAAIFPFARSLGMAEEQHNIFRKRLDECTGANIRVERELELSQQLHIVAFTMWFPSASFHVAGRGRFRFFFVCNIVSLDLRIPGP